MSLEQFPFVIITGINTDWKQKVSLFSVVQLGNKKMETDDGGVADMSTQSSGWI